VSYIDLKREPERKERYETAYNNLNKRAEKFVKEADKNKKMFYQWRDVFGNDGFSSFKCGNNKENDQALMSRMEALRTLLVCKHEHSEVITLDLIKNHDGGSLFKSPNFGSEKVSGVVEVTYKLADGKMVREEVSISSLAQDEFYRIFLNNRVNLTIKVNKELDTIEFPFWVQRYKQSFDSSPNRDDSMYIIRFSNLYEDIERYDDIYQNLKVRGIVLKVSQEDIEQNFGVLRLFVSIKLPLFSELAYLYSAYDIQEIINKSKDKDSLGKAVFFLYENLWRKNESEIKIELGERFRKEYKGDTTEEYLKSVLHSFKNKVYIFTDILNEENISEVYYRFYYAPRRVCFDLMLNRNSGEALVYGQLIMSREAIKYLEGKSIILRINSLKGHVYKQVKAILRNKNRMRDRDENDGGKESLILMMEGVSILLVGMIVISGTSKKSSRKTFKDTLSDEEEFKEAFRIIWEKIVRISAFKYRVPSIKSLGGRKGVDIVMSEYTRSRREGLSDLQAIRELIIEELNKGSEQQQIAEKIKPILKTAAIGMMNGGLEEYSSSLLVLFHNTEKFVKKAAEMVRKEEFSSKDGGNNIKINKFFDLPIDLLNIVLLGLTNITIKEVKSFADMPLAKGNNLFGLKSILNSTIIRKNIDIIDPFMKWLSMLTTSPPSIDCKIVKLPATKQQSYQLSAFSYLLYLINTILNITPVNTNRIAISHSVRLG
ncbi:MAG: hypothetical protein KAJ79_05965, partial [Candidatus Omnitrophica bacterium]|nr:hypothetical protein [Candidatus Omnitrophota bacterium]